MNAVQSISKLHLSMGFQNNLFIQGWIHECNPKIREHNEVETNQIKRIFSAVQQKLKNSNET